MTAQLLPIHFASGIDQSLSPVVGDARVTRMHNCRLDAAGRAKISPGYFQAPAPSNMRAVVQATDSSISVISSDSGLLYSGSFCAGENRVNSNADEAVKWAQPAFEAPTRINLPEAMGTWAAPTVSTHPDRWMVLSVKTISGGEVASLFIMKGTQIAQQVSLGTSYTGVRWRVVTDYRTGNGYLIRHDLVGKTFSIYTVTMGDTPLSGSSVTISALSTSNAMIDVACGYNSSNGATLFAVLTVSGSVRILSKISSTITDLGAISAGALAEAIAMDGKYLLTYDSAGIGVIYDAVALSVRASAATVAVPNSIVALSKKASGGNWYVSIDVANADTGDVDTKCYSISTSQTGVLSGSEVPYPILSAQPAGCPLVDASGNVYQVTINHATLSRSLQVSSVPDIAPLRTRRVVTAAHGEMPLFATAAQQGGTGSLLPSATPQTVTLPDDLCGEMRTCYVLASTYVTSGTLSETTAKTAGMAIVFAADATSMGDATHSMTDYNALSVTQTQYGRVLSSGTPFGIGSRGIATGAAIDLPAPRVTQEESTIGVSRFTAGQVYQYIVQYEYRSADGTLFRSPPSQPVTYTVVAATSPNTLIRGLFVTIGITPDSPEMPGIRVRLYRTENGGSVFYDTAASVSSTGIGVYTFTDHTSDATLIGQQLLTDGPAVSGGIKARYGFPPHRCSWNGRDRVIVGGLENPRHVRWSLLNYPGEATAFPHASEQGWATDVPDDVTAVAQLDDAWLIFSRTHIWAVYGSGPDDNGVSGGFDPPRLISPNLGCIHWKSLAEVESGLLFQGADGQIYLLQRGQSTIQWFSARVRDELSAGMVGTRLLNPIVSMIPHDAGQTVHIIRAPRPTLLSPILIYDRRTDAWSTDGDGGVVGLNGAIGGASIIDVFNANQQTVCTVTPDFLIVENQTGTPMAPIAEDPWTAIVETNDVSPFGFAGWGHIYKVGAVAECSAAATLSVSEWLSRSRSTADGTGTFTYDTSATDFPFMSWSPAKTKGSSVRVQISWDDRDAAIVGLVLSVEASQNAERVKTARKS